MKLFLTEGGHSGVAVTSDGDIVSLFNNGRESGIRGGSTQLLLNALSEGGKKLDNFNGGLSLIYQQHGFVPVVKVRFDEELAPPGWKKEWGQPYIIFWVHNGDSPAEVAQKIWNYPVHNFDEVPVVDSGKESYDKAARIRDEFLQRLEEARKGKAPAPPAPSPAPAPAPAPKPPLPTQKEIENEVGDAFVQDDYGLYSWVDVADWAQEQEESTVKGKSVSELQATWSKLQEALRFAEETRPYVVVSSEELARMETEEESLSKELSKLQKKEKTEANKKRIKDIKSKIKILASKKERAKYVSEEYASKKLGFDESYTVEDHNGNREEAIQAINLAINATETTIELLGGKTASSIPESILTDTIFDDGSALRSRS